MYIYCYQFDAGYDISQSLNGRVEHKML